MAEPPSTSAATKTSAVEAVAQSRTKSPKEAAEAKTDWTDEHLNFRFGSRLKRAADTRPYQRKHTDPLYRKLSIYTSDPAALRGDGSIAEVKLPYEPLGPGPAGSVFEVDNRDASGNPYPRADLEANHVLLASGYRPSLSSPEFQGQMVYAVSMLTYQNFRLALGRPVPWAFKPRGTRPGRLKLRPYGAKEQNAWYSGQGGEVVFGYFEPKHRTSVAPPNGSRVYTSLSHDIIVHEVSHALLDGLRAHFLEPTHEDVFALHEAFADLMAFFQQFQFEIPVRAALTRTHGNLLSADDLVSIAREFGEGVGAQSGALRTLVDQKKDGSDPIHLSNAGTEPHIRGGVVTRAVVTAFAKIYSKRVVRFVRLATGGRDKIEDGDLSENLLDLLVRDAQKLASQFQTICIRAIDYCPPVDVRFGDYLRALVTADMEMVPDDDLGYREILIRSFGERGIYGEGALHMTEGALRWNPPPQEIKLDKSAMPTIAQLVICAGAGANAALLRQLTEAVGDMILKPETARQFGIVSPLSDAYDTKFMSVPVVDSLSIARRVGIDQQLTFDIIAEVTQRRTVVTDSAPYDFYGGSTIIIDPQGYVRFAVRKRIDKNERCGDQERYMDAEGAHLWKTTDGRLHVVDAISKKLCFSK